MLLPMMAGAQRVDKPGEPYYIYSKSTGITDGMLISIAGLCKEEYIVDENNKKIKFISDEDFITFMSKRGWDYVEKVGITGYLFRKKVTSDEQAMEYLNIKQKKK